MTDEEEPRPDQEQAEPATPKEPTEPPGRELTLSLEDSVVTKEKMGG